MNQSTSTEGSTVRQLIFFPVLRLYTFSIAVAWVIGAHCLTTYTNHTRRVRRSMVCKYFTNMFHISCNRMQVPDVTGFLHSKYREIMFRLCWRRSSVWKPCTSGVSRQTENKRKWFESTPRSGICKHTLTYSWNFVHWGNSSSFPQSLLASTWVSLKSHSLSVACEDSLMFGLGLTIIGKEVI